MGRKLALKRVLIGVLAALVVAIVGTASYGVYLYAKANKTVEKIGASSTENEEVTETPVEAAKPITMLLLGIDNRKATGSMNTDVIMLASLNPEQKSASIVSLPRDTKMMPSGWREPEKANYFYAYYYNKDKTTVLKNTKKVFSEFFGVPIDAAVTVDFEGFRKAIDELGGITVNVEHDMRYVDKFDGTDINLKKGTQTVNGKQALDYIRYRKSNPQYKTPESSDLKRNERQQEVINQMVSKVFTLGGVMKLGQLMDVVGDHAKTDIPSNILLDFFEKYIGIDLNKIEYVSLVGDWDGEKFIIVEPEEILRGGNALRQQIGLPIELTPRSTPKPTATTRPTTRPPATPKVTPTPKPSDGSGNGSPVPGGTPKPGTTPKPGGTVTPTPTGTPGGTVSPSPSTSPSGSPKPPVTPKPPATPKPTATPKPSTTPNGTATPRP
jgi:polyisoprenyl-teichoic acid--peptidoglycan teichoic acid transferase